VYQFFSLCKTCVVVDQLLKLFPNGVTFKFMLFDSSVVISNLSDQRMHKLLHTLSHSIRK